MTFITPNQRTSSAPNGSRLGMPAHLEALIHKPDLKPFNWRKQVQQVEKITKQAEREQEIQLQRQKIEEERKRRQKIAKFEIDRKRNADAYNKSQLKMCEDSGKVTIQNKYLKHPMRTERLISIFCKAFNVTQTDLMAAGRKVEIVKHRQILMWLLHRNTGISYSALGRRIGGRDHSTAMHAIRKVNDRKFLLSLAEEMQTTVLFLEQEAYGDE